MSISGIIDGYAIEPLSLNGWVKCDSSKSFTLDLFIDNKLVDSTYSKYYRDDIGGDAGFRLLIPLTIELFYLSCVSGRVLISIKSGDEVCELKFYESLSKRIWYDFLKNKIKEFQISDGLDILNFIPPGNSTLKSISNSFDERVIDGLKDNQLSNFNLKLGIVSKNNVAVVGRLGFMFILKGANDLISMYKNNNSEYIGSLSRGWSSLFKARRSNLNSRGIVYRQIIVPEKSSVAPELFPVEICSCTHILKHLEESIRVDFSLSDSYVFLRDIVCLDEKRLQIIRKIDSHWTPYGSWVGFEAILNSLRIENEKSFIFNNEIFYTGDLGKSFVEGNFLRESLFFPSDDQFLEFGKGLERIHISEPPDGGHIGVKVIWKNSTALVNLKVVVFGNSFFERGVNSACFSWWAARWFREFHFLWHPDIDYDYIDSVKPDVVICQTIERFLPKLPSL